MDDRKIIQNRILEKINDKYDKSEGSFYYDNAAALAIELEDKYKDLYAILDKYFVDTSSGEFLRRKAEERGVYWKTPTKATTTVIVTGGEGAKIVKGDKVASDTVNFTFLEDKIIDSEGKIEVKVICEEYGSIGNVPVDSIKYFPITLKGLTSVTNQNPVTNGYDGETDEELRQRYYDKVRTPATSGNKYHFRNWAKEVTGVGDARVFPLWNGNGTVKVVIINSNKKGADKELIDKVFNHIEENRPIGAEVTVISANEDSIDIKVSLVVDTKNYNIENVKEDIISSITEYLKEIAFIGNYVSYAKIGSLIYNTKGVIDYSNLKLNDKTANITIGDEEVAVLGGVTIE
ncbi:baseplate J/gp47 family protein [Clostridium sp. MB40-C1]|uniref:baseplate J/gp47 family protein n=1 Tax=Clostridium sp. MB40-C1 TaxID=3070996 RepID=UPI0027E10262|nr:baseplate J/gp47 family protein [Clostridium sp. MB40-C1]WMJ80998.1 baseplate J/gp47 family protein [Clostridium sp. MB40-C1]